MPQGSLHISPILKHPDSYKSFIAQVDASETGVGAVLSQRFGKKPKLHPLGFFSRKLSPAERNYDIGNRKYLAMKLSLEECCHWLEEELYPFTIFTGHKNVEYNKSVKRLNSHQECYTLLLLGFSSQFPTDQAPGTQRLTLSKPSLRNHVSYHNQVLLGLQLRTWDWEIANTREVRVPAQCPADKKYMPSHLRGKVITWAYTSPPARLTEHTNCFYVNSGGPICLSCNALHEPKPKYPKPCPLFLTSPCFRTTLSLS